MWEEKREKNLLEFIIKMTTECVFLRERQSEQGDGIQGFMKEKDKNWVMWKLFEDTRLWATYRARKSNRCAVKCKKYKYIYKYMENNLHENTGQGKDREVKEGQISFFPPKKLFSVLLPWGTHLILSSERVERLDESCWMSESSTGWLRGHGCWPNTCCESMVSHTYKTRFRSVADSACEETNQVLIN